MGVRTELQAAARPSHPRCFHPPMGAVPNPSGHGWLGAPHGVESSGGPAVRAVADTQWPLQQPVCVLSRSGCLPRASLGRVHMMRFFETEMKRVGLLLGVVLCVGSRQLAVLIFSIRTTRAWRRQK